MLVRADKNNLAEVQGTIIWLMNNQCIVTVIK